MPTFNEDVVVNGDIEIIHQGDGEYFFRLAWNEAGNFASSAPVRTLSWNSQASGVTATRT